MFGSFVSKNFSVKSFTLVFILALVAIDFGYGENLICVDCFAIGTNVSECHKPDVKTVECNGVSKGPIACLTLSYTDAGVPTFISGCLYLSSDAGAADNYCQNIFKLHPDATCKVSSISNVSPSTVASTPSTIPTTVSNNNQSTTPSHHNASVRIVQNIGLYLTMFLITLSFICK